MVRVVREAGSRGATIQQLRASLGYGKERFAVALAAVRGSHSVSERTEQRPNRSGRLQNQVVLYVDVPPSSVWYPLAGGHALSVASSK